MCFWPSDGDADVEDGDRDAPLGPSEEVTDDGGGDGGVAGLSYSNNGPHQHQEPEVLFLKKKNKKKTNKQNKAETLSTSEHTYLKDTGVVWHFIQSDLFVRWLNSG